MFHILVQLRTIILKLPPFINIEATFSTMELTVSFPYTDIIFSHIASQVDDWLVLARALSSWTALYCIVLLIIMIITGTIFMVLTS